MIVYSEEQVKQAHDEGFKAGKESVVVKPTLCEVLAKIEKKAFWDYVPGRAVRVEDVKEILSEYFA